MIPSAKSLRGFSLQLPVPVRFYQRNLRSLEVLGDSGSGGALSLPSWAVPLQGPALGIHGDTSPELGGSARGEIRSPGMLGVWNCWARTPCWLGYFWRGLRLVFRFSQPNLFTPAEDWLSGDTGKAGVGQAMALQNSWLLRTNSKALFFLKMRKTHQTDKTAFN